MSSTAAKATRPIKIAARSQDQLHLDEDEAKLLAAIRAGTPFEGPETGQAAREMAERLLKIAFVSASHAAETAAEAVQESAEMRREISRSIAALHKSQAETRIMIEELING